MEGPDEFEIDECFMWKIPVMLEFLCTTHQYTKPVSILSIQ
jgi:hypothetical protein